MYRSAAKTAALILAIGSIALGSSVNYAVSSTYGASIPTTPLTSPNAAFSLVFGEPLPLIPVSNDPDTFTTTGPVKYSSGAITASDPNASIVFFDTASDGLFSIEMTAGADSYFWELIGPQIFTGPTSDPVLMAGTFPVDPSNNGFSFDSGALQTFGGGTITATSVPEPGSVLLLTIGLLAGLTVRGYVQQIKKKDRAGSLSAFAKRLLAIALFAGLGAAVCAASVPVNLASSYNVTDGIVTDGTTFSSSGGLDTGGAAYSANLLGASQSFGGVQFNLGPANAADAVTSATVPLPQRRFSSLVLLATGVQGNQTSQIFTVTYTDGTTTTITQSLSDWFTPQNFSGETTAFTMPHRDYFDGTQDNRPFHLYAYPFALDSGKSLASITLPDNRYVVVLAMGLSITPVSFAPETVNLSPFFSRTGIVTDGSMFGNGGLDGKGDAYSFNVLGSSQTFDGLPFTFGAANALDDVSSAGQTIALPAVQFADLVMLGTGVNGAQKSQNFTVTYSDGTTSIFTQNLSDWLTPQSFMGEAVAVKSMYLDKSNGAKEQTAASLYAYFFKLNSSKIVKSIMLPSDGNVEVLAITLSVLPVIPPPSGGICGTAATGGGEPGNVPYFRVYTSPLATWCVDSNFWAMPANQAAIPKFFAYGDAVIAQDIALFKIKPADLPFIFEVTTPTGGASTGNDFGPLGDTVTGDAFTNVATNPVTNQSVTGFYGYLLPLHESINVFTGLVSPDWPTDWWADHRSPFPNAMDEEFMRSIGTAENNPTLLAAADLQHERLADPSQPGFDSEVGMFEDFYNEFGGFTPFAETFHLVTEDRLDWDTVSPGNPGDDNHGELLTEYVIAYLQLGFHTTKDLTETFIADGVGTKDTTIPSYTPKAANVLGVANAHCSIRAAAGAGVDVNAALSNLQHGNFEAATVAGGTAASCPSECTFKTGKCVAPWAP